MRITIWHDVHRDHYDGYKDDHPMLRVFSYEVPDADPETELWQAVEMFNAPLEFLAPGNRATARAYRQRGLRSFSKGDGLSVLEENSTAERFWTSDGVQLLPRTAAFARLAIEGRSASEPLGEPVIYMIPALGDQIRQGLFEARGNVEAGLQKAIAVHHGVGPNEVVVIPAR
ncbi:hypothetical protein [Streptomyces anulatus]|uniref:hypothetical protein n=1 Tax=Streptomyces anulatus TaxID=1892 RepID=UPI001C260542|nr:hypothetical protein [Streptomyces anulatus]